MPNRYVTKKCTYCFGKGDLRRVYGRSGVCTKCGGEGVQFKPVDEDNDE